MNTLSRYLLGMVIGISIGYLANNGWNPSSVFIIIAAAIVMVIDIFKNED